MIPTNGSSFGRAGGRPRRGTAGTAEARHFTTFPGAVPNPRAASRRLSPSTYPARRTCPYSSTPFIPPPSSLQAEGYLVPGFYSGAAGLFGRFTEGFFHRRLQTAEAGPAAGGEERATDDGARGSLAPQPPDYGIGIQAER